MELDKSILVTGSHRSGTTWLGNVLNIAEGTRYVQEPFNRETYETLGSYRLSNMFAHAADEDEVALRKGFLDHVQFDGVERLILKDPIAVFSAPWIQEQFGVQVVCIVRHPAGFVSSLIKWNWEFHFGYFTAQPRLMESFPEAIRNDIERYARERQEPILQACLLWKAIYGWVLSQSPKKNKWIVINYEDLAKNPQKQYRKLYKKLGLKWDVSVSDGIKQMSGGENPTESDDPGFKARSSQAMREVWMSRLSTDQIDLVQEETNPLWKKFYSKRDWIVH